MSSLDELRRQLGELTSAERLEIYNHLRKEIQIHPLEVQWNVKAELILEAIKRASDLTQRGIRGIVAEATFALEIVPHLKTWTDITPPGDNAFDSKLQDSIGAVRVQIKMQRLKRGRPMLAKEGYRHLPDDMYVVETQKTRAGKDAGGENTRPYRFGEFDILAVCMHPSTGEWTDFVYTVANWLKPDRNNPVWLLKFQPVSKVENEDWTSSFEKVVEWYRSDIKKTIRG